jgi:Tol biopolymer transport system component
MAPPDTYIAMKLSRDGRLAAVTRGDLDPNAGMATLWLFDVAAKTKRVLADHIFPIVAPAWSLDSSAVAYAMPDGVVRSNIQEGSQTRLGRDPAPLHLTDWSPDGSTLLYGLFGASWDMWQLRLDGTGERPLLATRHTEGHGQFSPDGHWVVYVSDESGRKEVWVRSFETSSIAFKISDGGGYNPSWRADGRALYYLNTHRQLVEVDVHLAPTFGMGASRTLFRMWISEGLAELYASQYAVSPDGQRFLVKTPVEPPPPATVRVNWRPLDRR